LRTARSSTPFEYHVYGFRLRSDCRLPLLSNPPVSSRFDIQLFRSPARRMATDCAHALQQAARARGLVFYQQLPGGGHYVRWRELLECCISPDGSEVRYHSLAERRSAEPLPNYLVGSILSYALLARGLESLHGTAVVVDGHAIAFLGDSGHGKSSLASSFIQAGYPLLTDDFLVLAEDGGHFLAYPGFPRLKLYPGLMRHMRMQRRRARPMNVFTRKLAVPLLRGEFVLQPVPMAAIYVLSPPGRRVRAKVSIRRFSARPALMALLRNIFNARVTHRERLKQHLLFNARVVSRLPVKSLSYPRRLSLLPQVRETILKDVSRERNRS
jgi:hypothetical protein